MAPIRKAPPIPVKGNDNVNTQNNFKNVPVAPPPPVLEIKPEPIFQEPVKSSLKDLKPEVDKNPSSDRDDLLESIRKFSKNNLAQVSQKQTSSTAAHKENSLMGSLISRLDQMRDVLSLI